MVHVLVVGNYGDEDSEVDVEVNVVAEESTESTGKECS